MTATGFRKLIETKGKIAAVQTASPNSKCSTEEEADAFIFHYVIQLLDADEYGAAAIVLWGRRVFNPAPLMVRKVVAAIKGHARVLLHGAGSLGKSYSGMIWLLLDWLRDPEYTNIKLISTTEGHAKANTFSTMARLVRTACIKLPGVSLADYIGLDPKERNNGIAIVAIPTGDDGKGRLQGFHPIPRTFAHPKFGDVSRIRAFLDEAEKVPLGVWEGIDNLLTAIHGTETIKVIGAYNPHDPSTKTAQYAEPDGGWDALDPDTGVDGKDEWISREGWYVCRLDAKKTENVQQRKLVYPGFQTYEGYAQLEQKSGGNTPEFYTMARGMYPPIGVVRVVIQSGFLQRCRGDFIFVGKTTKAAGVDIAIDGRDEAVMTAGRFGLATAFQPRDIRGVKQALIAFPEPRMAAQVDQQFTLKKGDTKTVGDDIKKNAVELGIAPEWVLMDATGNGAGVYSYLRAIWSEQVGGLDFGNESTSVKILDQDKFVPKEKYDGVVTEVWFALAAWMEFLYIALAPGLRTDPLESETLSRRYKNIGKKIVNGVQREMMRVEKKDEQIARLGHSPDYADSLTLFLHRIRTMAHMMGSMTGIKPAQIKPQNVRHGTVDRIEWLVDEVL